MVPPILAIGYMQLINHLKHWKLLCLIRIYNLTVLFLNRYLEYPWVEMYHPSLPIYTYHGVNIAMWLNQQRRITIWQKDIIADIWMIYTHWIWKILAPSQKIFTIILWYLKAVHVVISVTRLFYLCIRVIDDTFVTGIYHKVDDFNFEVTNYPFPDSNIHSSLVYSAFYSQLIRLHRLCNNMSNFLFRAKLINQKLINRGYTFNLLRKSFMRFINTYAVELKYWVQKHDNVFL